MTGLADDDVSAYLDTLRSGWLTMGPRVAELEAALAERAGFAAAVAVSNPAACEHLARLVGADAGACVAIDLGSGLEAVGVLCTDDREVERRARLLRSHALTSQTWDRHRGHEDSYDVVDFGFNYRVEEARAAVALSRLRRGL